MSENALLTLVVVTVMLVLVVVVLRQQPTGTSISGPSVRVILLAFATVLFVLTGLGVIPAVAWGLACLAAAFLF